MRHTKKKKTAQVYCYTFHTNVPTGRSSDLLRRGRPFGIFPFLLAKATTRSRYMFSFLCSVWRFIDLSVCKDYPPVCIECDCENSAFHLLFDCFVSRPLRECFFGETGIYFSREVLCSSNSDVCESIVRYGEKLFAKLRGWCEEARGGT